MVSKRNPGPAIPARALQAVAVLSIAGILISSYLLYGKVTGAKSFCDFAPEISCDAVSQSPYSELPANSGIPIAGLGVIAFLIYLVPSVLLLRGRLLPGHDAPKTIRHLWYWSLFSVLFYLYLTYLELFVIYAICPLCVVTFIITIIIFVLLFRADRSMNRRNA